MLRKEIPMGFDYIMMVLIWLTGITAFVVFTPKQLKRRFILAVINFQAFIWLGSLIIVINDFILFPIHEFPNATNVLLTTEYFLYPLLYGFYVIYKPQNNSSLRSIYLLTYVSIVTAIDLMLVYFTDLVVYIHYTWYWKWITIFVLFSIANTTFKWFFKKEVVFEGEKRGSQ